MNKITKEDYKRQTNYVFVNSKSKEAKDCSVNTIATSYIALDKRKKVVALVGNADVGKTTSIHAIASAKRGEVLFIDKKDKTESEAMPYIINQTKFGMLIFENKGLAVADFNEFKTEVFEKKSLDVIMHKNNLFINDIELSLFKEAKQQLIETGQIKRNFSYRIFPDQNFKFEHETFKKLVNIYGFIDAFGLLFTQYVANLEENEDYLIYNFFRRANSSISVIENNIEYFVQLCEILKVGGELRVELAKFFLEITEDDIKVLTETMKNLEDIKTEETNNLIEENSNVIKETDNIIEEEHNVIEEKKSDTDNVSDVIQELITAIFEKIEKEDISLPEIMTKPEIMEEVFGKYYAKVEEQIDINTFGEKFNEAVMKMTTS